MRILLVSANYRPSVGGIERFVETLAEGLAARGHSVAVAACGVDGAPRTEEVAGVRIERIPASDAPRSRFGIPYPLPSPRACVSTLRSLIRRSDVVHAQDALYLTTIAALTLASRMQVPSVLTQHVGFVPQQHAVFDAVERAAITTLGRSARLADVVAAYNGSVAEWARRTWGLQDVRMLPVGVRSPTPTQDRQTVRRELGLTEEAFVALFTGRDVPKKRLDLFLAARHPNLELVAVTDRRNGSSPGTRLLPFTSPERFAGLLAAADAFVLPSEAEGFPLALQEALVAGIPCVVTPHPGYERYLADDDVRFVQPDPDAIRDTLLGLASNPTERRALAGRGAAAGEREFGHDRFVAAYESLYEALVGDRP